MSPLQQYYEDTLDNVFENHEDRMEQTFENMDIIDEEFQNSDKTQYSYYLGHVLYIPDENHYLMMNSISPELFFQYDSIIISEYLYQMSLVRILRKPVIDVVQLVIRENSYTCVMKTFWIKIIQRTWRKVLAEKMNILRKRGQVQSQRYFEIYGKYPEGIRVLPGLVGMMKNHLSKDNRYRN
jgi:hypothetical protein